MTASPFLQIPAEEWVAANELAFAVRDRFPVSPGHTLVVPRRFVATWWEATAEEQAALLALVEQVKHEIDEQHDPDGYNVGFNDGAAAGQTVDHLHIHVIPRYRGDTTDPRGGVRHVIPGKGNYLATTSVDLVDGQERLLLLELLRRLRAPEFDRIDFVVSFIMKSGLALLSSALRDALDREAHVRILTTDYMDVTDADALARLYDLADGLDRGRLETRIFHDDRTSFHPKAYLFWSSTSDAAAGFVGSNNLSRSGIAEGVEWSVGLDRVGPMLDAFDRLWRDQRTVPLTLDWLAAYRRERRPQTVVPIGIEIEPPAQPATPRPVQQEALEALAATRLAGHHAGLVVMATGLGKTWVAAFDSARPEFRRILFVAHRDEILRQSRDVFRQVQPDADLGLLTGTEKDPGARILFASVQTLANRLGEFEPDDFDYVVVDEFHHAAARTYRRVIDHFVPPFLLGLTATPDRLDGADLLALCGDNLVFERDLVDGIALGDLCPFQYHGIKDVVDFAPIPWRNGKFDPETLTRAVEGQDRAQQALDEWRTRGGKRTLAFCCSRTHADFTAEYFREQGVQAVSVHSGPTSAARAEAVEQLAAGELEVLFSVDVFNEGLDVPAVDTVLMLRPTDSPVVYLQQLGRGLRKADGKHRLVVIDFIGNHRMFLARPRLLLSLGRTAALSEAAVLKALRSGEYDLPEGCSVHYELDVIDMLEAFQRRRADDVLVESVRDFAESHGHRLTALQAWRAGLNMDLARKRFGSWFGLLSEAGLLDDSESEVVRRHGDVLGGLEQEQLTKAYKLVTLRALLQMGALRTGAPIREIARVSQRIVAGDPRLVEEARGKSMPDPAGASLDAWERLWRKMPIATLTGGMREQGRTAWFRIEADRLVATFDVPDVVGESFEDLVAEMVEYRLARHLLERVSAPDRVAIILKVNHAGGKPILMLDRKRYPDTPEGEVEFEADGEVYVGRFVKVAMNVATSADQPGNVLPDILRGWFGARAGHPGTKHRVVLEPSAGRWRLSPTGGVAVERSRSDEPDRAASGERMAEILAEGG